MEYYCSKCQSNEFTIEYSLPKHKWKEIYCSKCFWHLKPKDFYKVETASNLKIKRIENITEYDIELHRKNQTSWDNYKRKYHLYNYKKT